MITEFDTAAVPAPGSSSGSSAFGWILGLAILAGLGYLAYTYSQSQETPAEEKKPEPQPA